MKTSRFKITVKGEEADGSIRLNDLVEQLNALRSTLNQVDQAVSGLKSPSLYYIPTNNEFLAHWAQGNAALPPGTNAIWKRAIISKNGCSNDNANFSSRG